MSLKLRPGRGKRSGLGTIGGYQSMERGEIVECRAPSTESISRHQWNIWPTVSNDAKPLTKSQADLTRCPFSLNHYKHEPTELKHHLGSDPLCPTWADDIQCVDVSQHPLQPETPRLFSSIHALLSNITRQSPLVR